MRKRSGFYFITCLMLCGLLGFSLLSPTAGSVPTRQFEEEFSYQGPYIDEIYFTVYQGPDAQWAALIDGIIDVGNSYVTPLERSDIETDRWETNAFWGIACSTHHDPFFIQEPQSGTTIPLPVSGWPLNHKELRQAIAMAIDKYELARLAYDQGIDLDFGGEGLALDHVVPPYLSAWHNPDLPVDYRSGDLVGANALLDAAGFVDRIGDSYRDAPDRDDPVNIQLFYTPSESFIKPNRHPLVFTNTTLIAEYIGEALGNLNLQYTLRPVSDTQLYYLTHYGTRGYHLALVPFYIQDNTPFYLQDLFYSWNIPTTNIFNFDNDTANMLLEEMNTTLGFGDFQQVVWDVQDVIAENQPMIPLCTRYMYTAHRTDRFEQWVDVPGIGSPNLWSLLRTRLTPGQLDRNPITGVGGTLDFGLSYSLDTLNPIIALSRNEWQVLECIYSPLVYQNPITGEPLPGLAQSWNVEREGSGLKITFNLVSNATWHDGTPFSIDDVNFTLNFINNLPGSWGYPWPKPFINFTSIDIINNVTLAVHTPLDNYYALFDIGGQLILPQHIWEGLLNPAGFHNPIPIGTGPFRFVAQPEPLLIILQYFEDYHYGFPDARQTQIFVDMPLLTWLAAGSFVIIMTAIAAVWYLRRRPHGFEP